MSDENSKRSHDIPPSVQNVIDDVSQFAFDYGYKVITLDHLFYVLLDDKNIINVVQKAGLQVDKLREIMHQTIRKESPEMPIQSAKQVVVSERILKLLAQTTLNVSSKGRTVNDIRPSDIFYTLVKDYSDDTRTLIGQIFTQYSEQREHILQQFDASRDGNASEASEDFLVDLTQLAEEGHIDPVIGRDKEIHQITEILARKKKNNVILLGNPGVGKTAVVEGIALAIHNGECHETLKEKKIYTLDVAGMIAGTKYRGEFEERAREVLKSLCEDQNAIVFIDEMHTAMGAGGSSQGGVDLANIMKPMLARGDLMCIGATTWEEYQKHVQKDKAMVRRFENYDIKEPSDEDTKDIIHKLYPIYSEYHGVQYEDLSDDLVHIARRYIQNKAFPDKAIDIIDASGAYAKINGHETVDRGILYKIVSRISNVPVQAMKKSDNDVFENLADAVKKNLYGQDHVVDEVTEEILIAKSGMVEPNKPQAAYLLNGTTGVGKTEFARQLAKGLDIPLIKYDMSEYQESHSVSKLIGAPPGYTGYDDNAAKLIDDIEKNPNCVLLLDEIEKAHPKVLSTLLQVMDDATLTSSQGKVAKFNNVIMLMTANLGSREKNTPSIGFANTAHEHADEEAVNEFFSPEFINRLSGVVSFNNLTLVDMTRIVQKEIVNLNKQLETSGVKVSLSENAIKLLSELGYDPAMGARPLQRVIKDKIKKPLSKEVIHGKLKNGGSVKVVTKDNELDFQFSVK